MTHGLLSLLLSNATSGPGDGGRSPRGADSPTGGYDITTDTVSLDSEAIAAASDGSLDTEQAATFAQTVSNVAGESTRDERDERVAELGVDLAEAGVSLGTVVPAFGPLFDALVDRAFEGVEGDVDARAAALKRELRDGLADVGACVDAVDGSDVSASGQTATGGPADLDLDTLVHSIPHSTFVIDADHTVVSYNAALAEQLDVGQTEMLGEDCREAVAAATYSDGRRADTLADKVLDAPRDADEVYDVDRVEDTYTWGDQVVYQDRSQMKNESGTEQHIIFEAMPIFDDEGECVGVLELTEDNSEAINRRETMDALVTEVCSTLEDMAAGNFATRADFEDPHGVIDPELLQIVHQINDVIDDFEGLVSQVDEKTTSLAASIDEAVDATDTINDQVAQQNEALGNVSAELESFGATMEEVAASANQVSEAADDALEEAEAGQVAGSDAQDAMDDVRETGEALVETVEELDAAMDEIEEVTDVIATVADQTNLLALNANIEAARAGEDGDGFAVVAEEVKQLATETQSHTEAIAGHISAVQAQTADTVASVERSQQQIHTADERIQEAVASLETITERVDDAAAGISEVADANDDQASTVEEVNATIDEVTENASVVRDSVDEIATETRRQHETVTELADHIDELAGEASSTADQD